METTFSNNLNLHSENISQVTPAPSFIDIKLTQRSLENHNNLFQYNSYTTNKLNSINSCYKAISIYKKLFKVVCA